MNPEVALNTGLLTRLKPFNGRGSSWSGALGVWEKSNIFVAFPFYDFGHNLEPPCSGLRFCILVFWSIEPIARLEFVQIQGTL
jgi:hypothetical protein